MIKKIKEKEKDYYRHLYTGLTFGIITFKYQQAKIKWTNFNVTLNSYGKQGKDGVL